jgi:hypothetical protein
VTNQDACAIDLKIDLDSAAPGMTLSEAILDDNRGILLPGGAVLSEATITSLRRRGVRQISIVGAPASAAEWQAARDRSQLRLKQLFRRNDKQAASRALLACLAAYRLERVEP